jgi:hypothetical protein
MSIASLSLALLAPAAKTNSTFTLSTVEIIVIVVALVGVIAIIGWRAPDRSPHADEKAERDRIDD